MNIATNHIKQDNIKSTSENIINIFRGIKNSIVNFTSFLLLGAVSFSIIVALIFLVEVTTAGLLVSGFSQVLFG